MIQIFEGNSADIMCVPASMTRTLSQSMTVGILWAMLIIVQAEKSSRMIFWITPSVCESTDAVASSMNSSLLRFSITRPKHRSCLCPTLQLSPLSTTVKVRGKKKFRKITLFAYGIGGNSNAWKVIIPKESSFSGFADTTSLSWQRSRLYIP